MIGLYRYLRLTADALTQAGARFAIVGGIAVSVRTEPRFTRDVDFAVAVPDDAEAERILGCLYRAGFRTFAEFDKESSHRLATMRMVPPGGPRASDPAAEAGEAPQLVDLVFGHCGIEPEVVAAAEVLVIARGVRAPVAQVPHLIAMKLVSVSKARAQDAADLPALIRAATPGQLREVTDLLALVKRRGYAAGRDLPKLYRRYLADAGRGKQPKDSKAG